MPSRWQIQASHDDDVLDVVFEEQAIDCNIEAHSQCDVRCPPMSKPKGRPKRRRLKGGKELLHNMNTCGLCRGVGHNVATCSLKRKYSVFCYTCLN